MPAISDLRVAIIATDGVEESELTEPLNALRERGANVDLIALQGDEIQAFRHHDKTIRVRANRRLDEVQPGEYDALVLPGGALNADQLRTNLKVQAFLRSFQSTLKPVAAICHAPWILISADLVRGRTLTSYHAIQDDVRNAGGNWVDQEVVVDNNWVTSRQPSDLAAFNREMLNLFSLRAPVGYREVRAA